MSNPKVPMRKVREILRMKVALELSHRQVARALDVSAGLVGEVSSRAKAVGLTWETAAGLSDGALDERLRGPSASGGGPARGLPDFARVHLERRRPGVTLELLHLEYLESNPEGYRYSQFCEHYRRWVKRQSLSMRQEHRAGDKGFVDYSGKKPRIVERTTGEVIEVELFVAVLGASSYSFAEATRTQQSADWIGSHVRMFAFFGGVPRLVVSDQLRSAVTRPCRYEPGIQETYAEMAAHYGTAVLPARPGKPRDKAKVEVGVQVVQRWVLARLRTRTFLSRSSLNVAIVELVDELNDRPKRRLGVSRRQLFEQLDRPVLGPLPNEPYEHATWVQVRVNIDYHVEVDHHLYSVPYRLVHETVEVRLAATTLEVFHQGERVASHPRSLAQGRYTTRAEHMPAAHRAHAEWSPSRLIRWAAETGPQTAALVETLLRERTHPEQGYRPCLGILRLGKRYGPERLERACTRALAVGARSYRHVDAILKSGLDQLSLPPAEEEESPPVTHENVRGRTYYR